MPDHVTIQPPNEGPAFLDSHEVSNEQFFRRVFDRVKLGAAGTLAVKGFREGNKAKAAVGSILSLHYLAKLYPPTPKAPEAAHLKIEPEQQMDDYIGMYGTGN